MSVVGSVTVRVVPSFSGMHRQISQGFAGATAPVTREASRVGRSAGTALVGASNAVMGRNFTTAFRGAFGQATGVATAAGSAAGTGFMSRFGTAAGRSTAAVAGVASSVSRQFATAGTIAGSGFMASFTRMLGPLAGVLSLGAILGGGFSRLAEIDDAEAKFRGLGYSAEEIDTQMDSALGAVEGTTIGLNEAATAAVGAAGAGVDMGEDMTGWLTAIGDATAMSNAEYDHMAQIMNKVQGEGRVMGGDLTQMAQNGFEAASILAEHMGIGVDEVRTLASEGEISADLFQEAIESQIGGAAKEMSQTLSGSVKEAAFQIKIMSAEFLDSTGIADGFRDAMLSFAGFLENTVTPAISDMVDWFKEWSHIIKPIATTLAGVLAGFLAFKGVALIIGGITLAVRGLSAAIRAIPIVGWIAMAIGALIAFFRYTEVGQEIWEKVWDAMTTAASWAWENVIQPVFGWISTGWDYLMQGMSWAWENVLKPAWDALTAAATWMWENVLQPAWDAMLWAWDALSTGISWAWENLIKPAWDALSAAATWMWENVLQPVWGAIQWAWDKLSAGIAWAWENVIKPAWDALVFVLTWLWENVVSPIFRWIGERWQTMAGVIRSVWNNFLSPVFNMVIDIITWLWENVAKPYFENIWEAWVTVGTWLWNTWTDYIWPAIKRFGDRVMDLWDDYVSPALGWISDNWEDLRDTLVDVWENHIQPMLQDFGDFFHDEVVPRVEQAVDLIATAWDVIKKAFGEPIYFVLNTLWNNGIVSAFNFVADLIPGADPLPEVDVSDIPRFAKGGRHKGGWALVGEEGPELVNFSNPGRVYTADDTRDMFGGTDAPMTPEELAAAKGQQPASGFGVGNWFMDGLGRIADVTGISDAVDWARGQLADGFRAAMEPISDSISGAMEGRGAVGTLGSGFFDWAVDGIADWIDTEDAAQVAASGSYDGEFTANPGGFNRPAGGPITSMAGPRSYIGRFGNMHYGVDIGVPIGSAIRAAWDGVIKSRSGGGMNQTVVVNHGGFDTAYLHNSAITKTVGTRVSGGDIIARSGTAGSGPHLHFELHPGGWYNPSVGGVNSLFRDKGGLIYPGMNQVLNKTGKAEYVFNQQQFENLNRLAEQGGNGGRNLTVNQYGMDYRHADRNAQAFVFAERRESRKAGSR